MSPGMPEFHQNRYARELAAALKPGDAWLDIGAGHKIHGGWLEVTPEELAERAGYFAGCDIGQDVLDHPLLEDARIADAGNLPWEDAIFDLVSANMVVEHLADPPAVLREVRRVLKPGGKFVFVTPNLNHPVVRTALVVPPRVRRWYRMLVEGAEDEDVFPTLYRLNTCPAVVQAASASGLDVELAEIFRSTPPILPSVLGRVEKVVVALLYRLGLDQTGSNLIVRLARPADLRG